MLSRVAENLVWISRYLERAENVARLMDAARRMVTLPNETGRPVSNEWSSVLIAAGARDLLGESIETANEAQAVKHLIFDPENPSSVVNCFFQARENARAIREAMTQEAWEALNNSYSELRQWTILRTRGAGLSDILDWIKSRSSLFRGACQGTMLRNDGFEFLRIGGAIERVDSTARLLDVKYHVLLSDQSDVGSSSDQYQWASLLEAVSAQRSYYSLTRGDMSAKSVAEFLILNDQFPRSILFNMDSVVKGAEALAAFYGAPASCDEPLRSWQSTLRSRDIDSIINAGLHEFLTDVIDGNYNVANLIAAAYGFSSSKAISNQSQSQSSQS